MFFTSPEIEMANEDEKPTARLPYKNVPLDLEEKIVGFGALPTLNIFQILSNNIPLCSSFVDFTHSILQKCTTSRSLRELMILRGAQLWPCEYQWIQHQRMAKKCGIPQEKINEIDQWETSSLFDEKEKVVLELIESLLRNKGKLNDQLDEKLKKHFTESEYIELVLTGCFYVFLPTLVHALEIPVEN